MRLARFDNWSTGVVLDDDRLLDVTDAVQQPAVGSPEVVKRLLPFFGGPSIDWAPMIAAWDLVAPELDELVSTVVSGAFPARRIRHISEVSLLPPLPSPVSRIFAMAANFPDHAARAFTVIRGEVVSEEEVLAQAEVSLPSGFTVIPGTVIGHEGTVTPPKGHRLLDYEVEAAVVLRQDEDQVRFWGYTAWNDLSVRDKYFPGGPALDAGPLVWALQKNFSTGNVAGPWMVVEEFDENNLSLQTWVNGDIRQDGSTHGMIYPFRQTIEHLSKYLDLRTGDMLVSGTPAGTAIEDGLDGRYLEPGDVVEIQVGASGALRTLVGDF